MSDDTKSNFGRSPRNALKRIPARGAYDRETIFRIIDAAWIGHVGIVSADGAATVIPMFHSRVGDGLIFHGARSSRMMKYLASGQEVCVTFTLVDGLVLAKSLFHHSMNYRSVVAFGRGEEISDDQQIDEALQAISDKVMPGRWDDARRPAANELAATSVVRVTIGSASAKTRSGPPLDDVEDFTLPVWSGVLPIRAQIDAPIADEHSGAIGLPQYVTQFRGSYNAGSTTGNDS